MRRETQEFKQSKQLSIDMHCSHVCASICYYSWLHHRLFINRLKTVSFVFFRSQCILFYNMLICLIRGTFFFMVHSLYKYVQSNQWNTHEHKTSSQQEQTFFLQCSSLFLLMSVCSLLNIESMVHHAHVWQHVCNGSLLCALTTEWTMHSQWCSYANNAEAAYLNEILLFRFHNLDSDQFWKRFQWIWYSEMNIPIVSLEWFQLRKTV